MSSKIGKFLNLSQFAVVGASTNKAKFGNRILLAYSQCGRHVTGINPKEMEIEGIPCVPTLSELLQNTASQENQTIGVSFVTPPPVSLSVIEEVYNKNMMNRVKLWFQPGSYDANVIAKCKEMEISEDDIIHDGACVLVEMPRHPKL